MKNLILGIVGLVIVTASIVASGLVPFGVAPIFWVTSFIGGLLTGWGFTEWWDER